MRLVSFWLRSRPRTSSLGPKERSRMAQTRDGPLTQCTTTKDDTYMLAPSFDCANQRARSKRYRFIRALPTPFRMQKQVDPFGAGRVRSMHAACRPYLQRDNDRRPASLQGPLFLPPERKADMMQSGMTMYNPPGERIQCLGLTYYSEHRVRLASPCPRNARQFRTLLQTCAFARTKRQLFAPVGTLPAVYSLRRALNLS